MAVPCFSDLLGESSTRVVYMTSDTNRPTVQRDSEVNEPYFLQSSHTKTLTIDLDTLFTRDITASGSFDLRQMKDISFGKLLEAVPMPTLLIDSSFSIVFANEALNSISLDCSQVVGNHVATFFAGETEGGRATLLIQKVFEERSTQVFEGLVKCDDKILWCRIHLRSVRFQRQRLVLAIVEDLTAEKKQAIINEKYHRLVDIFPIGIAEFILADPVSLSDSPEDILSALARAELIGGNVEFAKLRKRPNIDTLKGRHFNRLLPFEERHIQRYYRWISRGLPVYTFESKERLGADSPRYYENTLVPNIKNDSLVGLWTLRQDVTHRKQTEADLREARDILEERVHEKAVRLEETNQLLTVEIGERLRAEDKIARLVTQLREALAKVKILSGLLPICASCKKIRDDSGYWTQVEVYVREHSDADFTHSICPECAAKLYPEFFDPTSYK